ncbi:hypothetical protein PGTUg99_019526 [Puccinia graminis f. sp. tritici]|uniref:Uncharacterized protein n=1 Tax=Puccinia graminis f. sp. tritici TaxID=56615 RepID=A0A5B0MFP7_PUCGR|nr:hypothetical protein PGTUg99_019526 [Puccinia graminis f. sp. tritici]
MPKVTGRTAKARKAHLAIQLNVASSINQSPLHFGICFMQRPEGDPLRTCFWESRDSPHSTLINRRTGRREKKKALAEDSEYIKVGQYLKFMTNVGRFERPDELITLGTVGTMLG